MGDTALPESISFYDCIPYFAEYLLCAPPCRLIAVLSLHPFLSGHTNWSLLIFEEVGLERSSKEG